MENTRVQVCRDLKRFLLKREVNVATEPCPFCGNKSEFAIWHDVEDKEGIPVCIICAKCGAHGPWEYIPKKVFTKLKDNLECLAELTGWNTRINNKDTQKEKSTAIRPCPFCGNKDEFDVWRGVNVKDREDISIRIVCTKCGTYGPYKHVPKKEIIDINNVELIATITGWNNRRQPC